MNTVLMIKNQSKKSFQSNKIVELLDIYPTLCEMTGLDLPSHLEGKSMIPVIENNTSIKKYAFSKFHNGESIISENDIYTEFYDSEKNNILSKMYYNHNSDKEENFNEIENPKYSEIITLYSKKLDSLRSSY